MLTHILLLNTKIIRNSIVYLFILKILCCSSKEFNYKRSKSLLRMDDDIIEVFASTSTDTKTKTQCPNQDIRRQLVGQFVETTKTDETVAGFYLDQFDWDLQIAVTTFLDEFAEVKSSQTKDQDPEVEIRDTPRGDFSLVTWNVDGLSRANLKVRVKAVCKIIEDTKVDIVFLQEVIPLTLNYFKEKRFRIYMDSFQIIPYNYSVMGRNLLFVEAHIGKAKLILMNTHLESTKDHATTRIEQLKKCISIINKSASKETTVIFGGDLNIRDKELTSLPPNFHDLWITNGSKKECNYTWDMTRNTNLEFPGRFKPRLRFDRLYIKYNENYDVKSDFFGLIGIEKISGTQSFPSDHWGILTRFRISSS
ncbi:TDP2 [Lepeophtheirus salmonis]|uniref:TDP2 n=1 Tax=Lepeophtheirus salmonis TaxID=72036 RepID=A0A7R8CGW0_LEPSM|nr:TDP2 [Lepeophtheirus salmonis]CAF2813441.1 TDP2 [Lepeophtheirus salmonis]